MPQLPSRLSRWLPTVEPIAALYDLDPLLVFAVMDRESLGGDALTPKGPSGTGDHGHGRGLMQIDDRAHKSFAGAVDDLGRPLWQDPAVNVMYGCRLLRRLIDSMDGWEAGALAAYNAGLGRVRSALARLPPDATDAQRLAAVDGVTTGRDYASNVLSRRERFAGSAPTPAASGA
ncbi:transglycosylase SLT domain-containing protein [Myxococcus virescens]|uniref:Transglycosylase SLT domain-containing protein n=1 Tax=Myxococcus virescens TaxID=83456 RepID=A0A511HSG6_9BACT|nr:transglycosylase SLT domain-containing protein [Myxococcus virescens]GEL75439.1 hypothetical protein MVI01_72230 [Myxococcus virescens]SDE54101.1 Transglycosylase SLT domain-containing protein [Myxococcus virescens]